ncbi:MAG: hypothetical protein K6G80_03445 [Treponema sp.]|nr:hypothetical protein [Treponema sp.]
MFSVKKPLKILSYVFSALYPVVVFTCLVLFKVPVRIFSLFVIGFAFVFFLAATGGKDRRQTARLFASAALFFAAGTVCFITGSSLFLKLYPVCVSGIFLLVFAYTLFSPPSMVFRFATLMDKSIVGSPSEKQVRAYCRNVTIVWCVFFILNGAAALTTVLIGNDFLWSVYNGGISYVLMGLLFAGEFVVRKIVQKKQSESTS